MIEGIKKAGQAWNSISLVLRIVMGLVIGTALGIAFTDLTIVPLMGELFVAALKAVAPILVFFLVIGALANATSANSMKTVLLLYLISTFMAAAVATIASRMFPVELVFTGAQDMSNTPPSGIGEVLSTLVKNIFSNPVDALMSANYIGILAWAVVLGIALRVATDNTKTVFANIAEAVSKVVRWIIALAPFGVCGLVYSAVTTSGLDIFTIYGQLLLVLVGCMVFIALIANPLMVYAVIRRNPYPLVLRCLKDSGITAFFTRSSAANIPVNMTLCDKLGLEKDNYSVSIPLGATINMAGAAVTISVMAMMTAYTVGVEIDIPTAIILCVLAAVSACGASGVAGGSLLLIPLACSLFGIDNDVAMQAVGIGLVIGVIQDSCETALNSSSDVLFTATAEYREWIKQGRDFLIGKDNKPLVDNSINSMVTEFSSEESTIELSQYTSYFN